MEPSLRKSAIKKLVGIDLLLSDVFTSMSYVQLLFRDDDDPKKRVIKSTPFFKAAKWSIWRSIIIDLNKILSQNPDNDYYSLNTLLNCLETGVKLLKSTDKEDFISQLETHKLVIQRIKIDRNKLYAHRQQIGKPLLKKEQSDPILERVQDMGFVAYFDDDYYEEVLDLCYVIDSILQLCHKILLENEVPKKSLKAPHDLEKALKLLYENGEFL